MYELKLCRGCGGANVSLEPGWHELGFRAVCRDCGRQGDSKVSEELAVSDWNVTVEERIANNTPENLLREAITKYGEGSAAAYCIRHNLPA